MENFITNSGWYGAKLHTDPAFSMSAVKAIVEVAANHISAAGFSTDIRVSGGPVDPSSGGELTVAIHKVNVMSHKELKAFVENRLNAEKDSSHLSMERTACSCIASAMEAADLGIVADEDAEKVITQCIAIMNDVIDECNTTIDDFLDATIWVGVESGNKLVDAYHRCNVKTVGGDEYADMVRSLNSMMADLRGDFKMLTSAAKVYGVEINVFALAEVENCTLVIANDEYKFHGFVIPTEVWTSALWVDAVMDSKIPSVDVVEEEPSNVFLVRSPAYGTITETNKSTPAFADVFAREIANARKIRHANDLDAFPDSVINAKTEEQILEEELGAEND